ncbi:MAG: glycosyltransferase, partial [Acidobacteriota bacterium]|nr:glycosyltransferase [Acidobacteriota bacterium]
MEQSEGQRSSQTGFPTCTVVVPTRNRFPHLERVLEAVEQQDHKPSEVVVVDSAPTLVGAQDIASRFGARYVLEPLPGASRARNSGAAQSQSEVVVFLDDDALPEPDWLRNLLMEFSEPDVGVVTGRVLPWPKGSASGLEAAVVRGAGADGRFGGEERFVLDRKSPGWFELCTFGGFGIAANMAVRSSAFWRVGGFDLLLGPGAPLLLSEEYYLY